MREKRYSNQWVIGGSAMILIIVAIPLWQEFREPGNSGWNAFLALFLVALAIRAVLLKRHFRLHKAEIGEARFDTSNKVDDSTS